MSTAEQPAGRGQSLVRTPPLDGPEELGDRLVKIGEHLANMGRVSPCWRPAHRCAPRWQDWRRVNPSGRLRR